MQAVRRLAVGIAACALPLVTQGLAQAQVGEDAKYRPSMFIEGFGAAGVQLGQTDYLPSASTLDYQFPLVYGFAVGGTAGMMVTDNVALVASYQYSRAQSRDGSITGVVDNVEGRIDYHTAVGGIRLWVPVAFGAFRGDLQVGIVFPHATELQLDYGPALAGLPQPITGQGLRIEHFSIGFGGQARLGYQMPIHGPVYAAIDATIEVYQSENAGETTELRNFVVDFDASPPVAIDGEVPHGDGAARPQTESVQSGRLQLSIGAMF